MPFCASALAIATRFRPPGQITRPTNVDRCIQVTVHTQDSGTSGTFPDPSAPRTHGNPAMSRPGSPRQTPDRPTLPCTEAAAAAPSRLCQDAAVQPGRGSHLRAKLFRRSPRRGAQTPNLQSLHRDRPKPPPNGIQPLVPYRAQRRPRHNRSDRLHSLYCSVFLIYW